METQCAVTACCVRGFLHVCLVKLLATYACMCHDVCRVDTPNVVGLVKTMLMIFKEGGY